MRLPADARTRLLPILLAQATGLVCGLAGVRLVSQWVTPEDYGAYGVFVTLALVGSGVVYAGLVKYVSRHWQDASDRRELSRAVFAALLRKSPWLVAAAVAGGIVAATTNRAGYGALLFGCAFLIGLLQLAQSALQAARENWADFAVSGGVSVTRSFAPPLLYHFAGGGLIALLSGFLLQAAVGAALGGWMLRRWWVDRSGSSARTAVPVIYDGPRFIVTALAAWALLGLNRWLVAWLFGAETAGYFTLATNIGAIIPTILGAVLLQYVQPNWFARRFDTREAQRQLLQTVDRVALIYTAGSLAAAAALHAGMPLLIGPFIDARYSVSVTFILSAAASSVALFVGNYYHAMLIAVKAEPACLRVDLSGAAGLALGTFGSAIAGLDWFTVWLIVSPALPWLVNRPLARRALLNRAVA